MLVNPSRTRIVSHLPKIDGNNLWLCETGPNAVFSVPISNADRVTVSPGSDGHFAVVHHRRGQSVEITAHRIDGSPTRVISRIFLSGRQWRFEGESDVWQHLPRAYFACYTPEVMRDTDDHLIIVNAEERAAEPKGFPAFYGTDNHRWRVQAILDVPKQPAILVEQSGDEHPFILFNYKRGKVGQRFQMTLKPNSARYYRFREHANEFWIADPDHLTKLAPSLFGEWVAKKSIRLQLMDSTNGRYTGQFGFTDDESLCVVARPFLGDAVVVDTAKVEIVARVHFEGMPQSVAVLPGGQIYAREWNSGRLLRAAIGRQLVAA